MASVWPDPNFCTWASAASKLSTTFTARIFSRNSRPKSEALAGTAEGMMATRRAPPRSSAPAAQEDGVPALDAQRGCVDGHVGTRLVDDGDDAERDAHLADEQAVGATGHSRDRPHWVFQTSNVLDRTSDGLEALVGQREAADERRRGRSTLSEPRHVGVVRFRRGR